MEQNNLEKNIVELDLELNGIDRCKGCPPEKREERIQFELYKDQRMHKWQFWDKKWSRHINKKFKGIKGTRQKEFRLYWLGDQIKFMAKNKNEKKNNVIYCNVSGTMELITEQRKKNLIKIYGSWELAKKHYINLKYGGLLHTYGPAWLYLQRTPLFIEFKKKVQVILRWYNATNTTPEDFELLTKKLRPLCRKYMVGLIKPIYYKKNGGRVTGIWLKGLPFIYDIFISAETRQAEDIDPSAFEVEKDSSDALYKNPEEEEYIIDEPVRD